MDFTSERELWTRFAIAATARYLADPYAVAEFADQMVNQFDARWYLDCPKCKGHGQVANASLDLVKCGRCSGTGKQE